MTTSKSLRTDHARLLQAEARGGPRPILADICRLAVEAIDHAAKLETELAGIAEQPEAFLAKHRKIAHIWGIEDVKEVRPDLTDEQAWEVLQAADRNQSSEHGLCWDTFETIAEEMFSADEATGDTV